MKMKMKQKTLGNKSDTMSWRKYLEELRRKEELLKLLERVYVEMCLELTGKPYGFPMLIGNYKVWRRKGIFERFNKYRKISWEEFKKLLEALDSPKYYGRIYVAYYCAPTNARREPHCITFWEPVFLKWYEVCEIKERIRR